MKKDVVRLEAEYGEQFDMYGVAVKKKDQIDRFSLVSWCIPTLFKKMPAKSCRGSRTNTMQYLYNTGVMLNSVPTIKIVLPTRKTMRTNFVKRALCVIFRRLLSI